MKHSLKLTFMLSMACNVTLAVPQGVPVGPFRLLPEVVLTLGYDDNVTYLAQNEISSFVTKLAPKLTLEKKQKTSLYSVTADAEIGRYLDSSADNYQDYQLLGKAAWGITGNTGLGLDAFYKQGHDTRGATDRSIRDEANVWNNIGINGLLALGQNAKVSVEGKVGYNIKRYQTFDAQELQNNNVENVDDYDETSFGITVFYKMLARTRLFLEGTHRIIAYDISQDNAYQRDSNTTNVSLGAVWNATAKTTGTAQIGYLTRDFDTDSNEDFSGASWKVGVDWKATTRADLNITTARYLTEATGVGYNLITNDLSVTGKYRWKPRFYTAMGVYLADTEFVGSQRTDDIMSYDLSAHYELDYWNTLFSAGVQFTNRESDNATIDESDDDDYDRTYVYLSVKMAY